MSHLNNGPVTLGRQASGVRLGYEGTTPTPLRRGTGSFRRLDPELRALAREAYALWRALAVDRANPYGDHTGCLLAGRMAVDATRWEDGLVILAAIRQRMDEKSSPRWIPEWARTLGAERREAANRDRKIVEQAVLDNIDPEARRVMIAVGRAKARGRSVSLESATCAVCRQFTETKCVSCQRALHARACPTRHECAA